MTGPVVVRSLSRRAGVLLHLTSLPGQGPVGDIDAALGCVGPLAEAGVRLWQILPLCPPDSFGSPYSSWSSLSGSPLLIGLESLVEAGLLSSNEIASPPQSSRVDHCDLGLATVWKLPLLERAAQALLADPAHPWHREWEEHSANHPRVSQAGLFFALRTAHGGKQWWDWPPPVRNREPQALEESRSQLRDTIDLWTVLEFFFARQWSNLRAACAHHGIELVGDLPIYVGTDSVDVWANPEYFQLGPDRMPVAVSGCPPDALNDMGQWWGTPLYRWPAHAADEFKWWVRRVERMLQLTDWIRVDHFVGLVNYWSIPVDSEDARSGSWKAAPGEALLHALAGALGPLPMVAEDLGVVSEAVSALRDDLQIPGMTVLQFAFDGAASDNPHHPSNHPSEALCCTGTHDTPTMAAWWDALDANRRSRVLDLLEERGFPLPSPGVAPVRQLVDLCLSSSAAWSILPLQDLLALGPEGRMNTPGTTSGNWTWRLQEGQLHRALEGFAARVVEHKR